MKRLPNLAFPFRAAVLATTTLLVLSRYAQAAELKIPTYPFVEVYAILEQTTAGYRFMEISFRSPTDRMQPWVALMSGSPVFFTEPETNCAVGESRGNVNVNARRCQSLLAKLFRAEKKSGSQKLTNALGALSTLGMSGSLRMTDIDFDEEAYRKAFMEADAHMPVPRERMSADIRNANAAVPPLQAQFEAVKQTTVKAPAASNTRDIADIRIPPGSPADSLAKFLDTRLVDPWRTSILASKEAVNTEQDAKVAERHARVAANAAFKARLKADREEAIAAAQKRRENDPRAEESDAWKQCGIPVIPSLSNGALLTDAQSSCMMSTDRRAAFAMVDRLFVENRFKLQNQYQQTSQAADKLLGDDRSEFSGIPAERRRQLLQLARDSGGSSSKEWPDLLGEFAKPEEKHYLEMASEVFAANFWVEDMYDEMIFRREELRRKGR